MTIALLGCSTASKYEPNASVVVSVQTAIDRARAAAKVMNEIIIELPPLDHPGTQWTIVFLDPRFLKQLGAIEVRPDGKATARFVALRPGRRAIRFAAVAAAARKTMAAQVHEVLLEIE